MGRRPSPIRTAHGQGLTYTARDHARIAMASRWGCVTAAQIIATERGGWPALGDLIPGPHALTDTQAATAADTVRRRMGRVAAVTECPAIHASTTLDGLTHWTATPAGVALTDTALPGRTRPVSPQAAPHTIAATWVGIGLEARGYRVTSEREIRARRTVWGDDLTQDVRHGGEVPDLAVRHPDGTRWIAVEVERQRNRPAKVYQAKILAYLADPACSGVIYVCTSRQVQARVGNAAQALLDAGRITERSPLAILASTTTDAVWPGRLDGHERAQAILDGHR